METSEVLAGMLGMYFVLALGVVFIVLFGDVLRRHDISGWAKAGWLVLLLALPFLGCLIYIIVRPKKASSGYDSLDPYPSQRIQPMR